MKNTRIPRKYDDALCNYILEELFYEKDFSKIIYEYLITGGQISGTQLCLILFDQGVLPYKEEIAALDNGSVTAVSFLKDTESGDHTSPAGIGSVFGIVCGHEYQDRRGVSACHLPGI